MSKAALNRSGALAAACAALGMATFMSAGTAAAADVCAEGRGQADAGQITKALSGKVLAQNCADGKNQMVPGSALVGQRVKRIGPGGYLLPDYGSSGIRVSSGEVEVRR